MDGPDATLDTHANYLPIQVSGAYQASATTRCAGRAVGWPGHESIETTNVYVHANLAMKEKALAKIQPMDTPFRRFRPDDRLLSFLEAL